VGCTGAGKTTLLKDIGQYCKDKDIPVHLFNNLTDDRNSRRFAFDVEYMAMIISASEGEAIMTRVRNLAGKLGTFINKNADQKQLFILIDALDSGFSIDSIQQVKEQLFDAILKMQKEGQEIYIIVSSNEYELCDGEKCFDVQECRYRKFPTYNSFRKFVLKSREKRDKIG
jgi:hypothetical protein